MKAAPTNNGMNKHEYEIIRKLGAIGYHGILKLEAAGYVMKVKKQIGTDNSAMIEPKVFALCQKYGYRCEGIDSEEYNKANPDRIVAFAYFVKRYEP